MKISHGNRQWCSSSTSLYVASFMLYFYCLCMILFFFICWKLGKVIKVVFLISKRKGKTREEEETERREHRTCEFVFGAIHESIHTIGSWCRCFSQKLRYLYLEAHPLICPFLHFYFSWEFGNPGKKLKVLRFSLAPSLLVLSQEFSKLIFFCISSSPCTSLSHVIFPRKTQTYFQ